MCFPNVKTTVSSSIKMVILTLQAAVFTNLRLDLKVEKKTKNSAEFKSDRNLCKTAGPTHWVENRKYTAHRKRKAHHGI